MGSGPGGQRPIEGYRQHEKEKHIEEPPPEDEFKKIMEVESATEAPQKRKRREDEGAEEIEGLNIPERTLESPIHKEPSPLEVQAPKSLKKETYSGQKNADMIFVPQEEMVEEEPMQFLATPPEEEPASNIPVPSVRPPAASESQTPVTPKPQSQEPQAPTNAPQVQRSEQAPQTQEEQPQQQNQDQQSQTEQSQSPQNAKAKAQPLAKEPSDPLPEQPQTKKTEDSKTKKGAPKAAAQIEEATSAKAPPEEISKIQKEKQKKDQAEKVAESGGVTPTQTPEGLPGTVPTAETALPSYLNLSPAVFELFDKMVSYITIEHTKSGTTTATVHIEMKGSVFDGAKLELKRVPTAPNTFNVQLQGTPEAVQLFNASAQDLAAAFQHGKYSFDVNVQRASLLDEYRSKARRVTRKEDTEKGA